MALGKFIPSPFMQRIVLGDRAVKDGLKEIVDDIAEDYREGVGRFSSDLYDSISGEVVTVDGDPQGVIEAADWKARLHEYGGSRTKPNSALRNAIAKAGLKLTKDTPEI